MSINENRMQASTIKKSFIEKWSLEKIKTLTIEDYVSNGDKSGFCYELEFGTPGIGSIRGGNSIKFGLYKRKNSQDEIKLKNVNSNEQYTWQSQLGSDAKSAFESIKKGLIDLIAAAQTGTLEDINKVDLPFMWNVVKWKLAFMYAPEGTLVDIFSSKWLLSYSGETTLLAAYNNIMKKYDKNQYDSIWDFSLKVWEEINNKQGSEAAVIDEVPIDPEDTDPSNPRDKAMTMKHNTILFGPPGTGKTFNTINHALSILIGSDKLPDNRTEAKNEFDAYVAKGQIVFTTFHQSYGYEEFIEGIKALPPKSEHNDTDQLVYEVMPGIFKRLCETAKNLQVLSESNLQLNYTIDTNVKVWKVSLGGARERDVKKYCFDNSEVRIGWSEIRQANNEDADFLKQKKKTQTTLNYFENEIEIGDFVVSLYDADHIDGVGIVSGEYEWDDNFGHYPRMRKVNWLWTKKSDEDPIYIADINKKGMVQQTVYRLWNVQPVDLLKLISDKVDKENSVAFKNSSEEKKYVIIIDEINRGNISKIFGELITLIEPSKRLGADEAMTVKLPYSGYDFGVPSNVYIIGTMNTADRSIALMDTALRRRFEFIEMMPDYDVIARELGDNGNIDLGDSKKLDIVNMLKTINQRISYLYDRDHQIGHAYLLSLKGKEGKEALAELDNIFRNKIIPLLQEYFYDDWEKIQIVLGDHENQSYENEEFNHSKNRFIDSTKLKVTDILGLNHDDIVDETISYTIKKLFTESAYIKLPEFRLFTESSYLKITAKTKAQSSKS